MMIAAGCVFSALKEDIQKYIYEIPKCWDMAILKRV